MCIILPIKWMLITKYSNYLGKLLEEILKNILAWFEWKIQFDSKNAPAELW